MHLRAGNIKMSKSEIEKIKAVLSEIVKDEEHILAGRQKTIILELTKVAEIAIEALYWYDKQDIKVTKTECGTGLMHPLATQSLKQISEILEAK